MLTVKEEMYVQNLLKGMSQREAYKNSYNASKMKDNTIDCKASLLLKKEKVKARYDELIEEVKDKALITVEEIIKELRAIAFVDRTKISKNVRNTLAVDKENGRDKTYYEDNVIFTETSELTDEEKKVIAGYKKTLSGFAIETYDKVKALELLGKYVGMFNDKQNITINNNVENPYKELSTEELKKLAGE